MLSGKMSAVKPNTNPMLAILDPIIFPNEISGCPESAASKLIKSSGAEVANQTTVIPTTKVEILSRSAKETEPFTKNSPPMVNKDKPKMR